MSYMLMQHTVKDFAEWKKVFNSKSDLRTSSGELSHQIFRDTNNPNSITVIQKWDSLENAQHFSHSPELRAAMADAGVEGIPNVSFLNEV